MQIDGTSIGSRITEMPFSSAAAVQKVGSYLTQLPRGITRDSLQDMLRAGANLRELTEGVFDGSPFLMQLATRYPDAFADCLQVSPEAIYDGILAKAVASSAQAKDLRDVMTVLRQSRSHLALLCGLCDLAGIWDVENVTRRLSAAADAFVASAVDFLLRRPMIANAFRPADAVNPARESGLVVIAMGKFGAEELNYSSDIDIVVFFDPEIAKHRVKGEPQAFFVRLVRDLVHILQERTADGYVFRTDLRLRPDPASTQAAMSTAAAYRYYETQGQNWERAAYIKSRPVAGDIDAGWAFLRGLEPYVWRRYLDYNAIADIHAMKRQIHAAKGHAHIAVAGHNVKLGRGGIREVEFFVQSQQLIGGGRQPSLRSRKTLDALDRLYEFEWIDNGARTELGDAYRFLRRTEHRLQMVSDQQTHTLPSDSAGMERFSRFSAFSTLTDFERALCSQMHNVQRHYAGLFEDAPEGLTGETVGNLVFTGDAEDPGTVLTLTKLGFKNSASAIALVKGWHFGRYRAMRTVRAREILTEFTPAFLKALGETGDPDLALATFDRFLSELPAAVQLFSLLRSNPDLLKLLARIMGSAPRLARVLSRRNLLDAILDPSALSLEISRDGMRDFIDQELQAAGNYERQLDRARVLGQEQAFFIGVSLLMGRLTPTDAGRSYSLLAETMIAALLNAVQKEFGAGFPPPAVVAMGKLGGREMTATSDLDLIVIYEGGGASASQHYARFTHRLIAALSAPTAEGVLYPVDMRLRPSGKAGPVAVSFDGFRSYQHHQAWTWEHLALARARLIAGPRTFCKKLEAEIASILSTPRDRLKTASDVREMRALIMKEKGSERLWDLKHHAGGLVDVEFIAQFLQIVAASAGEAKNLIREVSLDREAIYDQNTRGALRKLIDAKLLSATDGEKLHHAAESYETINQIVRLCAEGAFEPGQGRNDLVNLILERTGEPDLPSIEARLRETYRQVEQIFARVVV